MILYVAIVSWNHEGQEIIGIYDSEVAAEKACSEHRYKDGRLRGHERYVEEYFLNETQKISV